MRSGIPLSFNRLRSLSKLYGWEQGHETLTLTREGFLFLIRHILAGTDFDDDWYLETYPDVAQAINDKKIESAWNHYVNFGYFEGRLPTARGFDPKFYAQQYPDVARTLKSTEPRDLLKHFMEHGYAEGRLAAPQS